VNLIGYGTSATGVNYWLLRNSWGTSWGELGYFRIFRNMTSNDTGMFGMLQKNSYPIIA
jgi:C1A family cysteine protease